MWSASASPSSRCGLQLGCSHSVRKRLTAVLCLQAAALLTQEMRVLPEITDAFVSVLRVADMADILSLTEEVIDGVLHTLDQQAFGEFPIPDAPLVCLAARTPSVALPRRRCTLPTRHLDGATQPLQGRRAGGRAHPRRPARLQGPVQGAAPRVR